MGQSRMVTASVHGSEEQMCVDLTQIASKITGDEPRNTSKAQASMEIWEPICSQVRKFTQPGVLYAYAPSKELKIDIESLRSGCSNQPPWPQGGVWPIAPS